MTATPARFLARDCGRMLALPLLRSASPRRVSEAWAACFPDRPIARRRSTGPALLSLAEARELGRWLEQQQAA